MGSAGGQGQASMTWGCSDKIVVGVCPGWVVVDFLMTLKADGQKILHICQLFADSPGLVVNLRGRPSANLASGVFGEVLKPSLPIKRTHPPALG